LPNGIHFVAVEHVSWNCTVDRRTPCNATFETFVQYSPHGTEIIKAALQIIKNMGDGNERSYNLTASIGQTSSLSDSDLIMKFKCRPNEKGVGFPQLDFEILGVTRGADLMRHACGLKFKHHRNHSMHATHDSDANGRSVLHSTSEMYNENEAVFRAWHVLPSNGSRIDDVEAGMRLQPEHVLKAMIYVRPDLEQDMRAAIRERINKLKDIKPKDLQATAMLKRAYSTMRSDLSALLKPIGEKLYRDIK
uniref:Alpha-carbonic anhydrase domain-containing protein n=1 Tax=Soboliphyme baturini TaxID=241478 RepID=A0A183J9E7_9BILA